MTAAQSDLLRKFTELAFDESAEMGWQVASRGKAGCNDEALVVKKDLQNDWLESSGTLF
jgi:hypothetical protein